MATKRELVVEVGRRYRVASSGEKRRILDEFVALTGYHRKHALRLLNGGETCYRRSGRPRSRTVGIRSGEVAAFAYSIRATARIISSSVRAVSRA